MSTISVITTAPRPLLRPWAALRLALQALAVRLRDGLAQQQVRVHEREAARLLARALDARTLRDLGLDGIARERGGDCRDSLTPEFYRGWM